MHILIYRLTNKAEIHACLSTIAKIVGVSSTTMTEYRKSGFKELATFYIFFDCEKAINKRKRRNNSF